jgi:hypothetical protein
MKEIWIVKASAGQYDDYWQWDVVAFSTELSAQDYVAAIPETNYEALQELQELQTKYCSIFYEQQDVENFTDVQWGQYYEQEEALNNKALTEVQAKYPDADLTVDENFNGYSVYGPVKFGG